MKRPMFVIGTCFAITTWLAFLCSAALALQVSLAFALTGVVLLLLKKEWLRLPCLICLSAAIALGSYSLFYTRTIAPFSAVDGKELWVEGVLLESTIYANSASYLMLAEFPNNPELPQRQYLSLRSYERLEYLEGDALRCVVTLGLPENSGRESYYRSKGIMALGTLRLQYPVEPVSPQRYALQNLWLRLRGHMRTNLQRHLTDGNAQLVGAMTLGLKGDVDPLLYNAVNKSGTSHLLSVSGLHLSILTAFLLGALKLLRLPRKLRYFLCILQAFGFAVLVGFSGSIIRAFIMTGMTLLGRMFYRGNDSRSALGLSLLVISVIWPYWTLGRGLWLSAGSTLGIILFAGTMTETMNRFFKLKEEEGQDRVPKALVRSLAVSLSAYVFSLPILLVSSGWFSLLSPVANLLITPFTTPVILGGVVCAFVGIGGLPIRIVAAVTDFCVGMIVGISKLVADLPFSTFALDESYLLIIAGGVVAGVIVLVICKANRQLVAYGLVLCLACVGGGSLSLLRADRNKVELVTLAGCDTALLLRDGQAVLLGAPGKYDVGSLLKYLSFRGIDGISAVIAPNYGNQVDSGMMRLMDNYPTDCIIGPDDAYILDMLQTALPDTRVLSGGFAEILVLDAANILIDKTDNRIFVRIGSNTILKTNANYAIIEDSVQQDIRIFRDGILILQPHLPPLVEPVGQALFGESRILLNL